MFSHCSLPDHENVDIDDEDHDGMMGDSKIVPSDSGLQDPGRRKFFVDAARVAGALYLISKDGFGCKPREAGAKSQAQLPEQRIAKTYFDNNPDYFYNFPNGEFPKEEREKRIQEVASGIKIFRDIGLTFYYVKPGDTISEIRQKLSKYKEFQYLRDQRLKLQSFNIPAKHLEAGMWIPIPFENVDRILTDEQFVQYCKKAILNLKKHTRYAKGLQYILQKISQEELIALMLAAAKQESGGKPLGQMEFHRWEQGHRCFSFSIFHVLMTGPGIQARRNLGRTEGQLYHPQNAAELFLAFILEKSWESKNNPRDFFPFLRKIKEFAYFYNGQAWQRTNPRYVANMTRYYKNAVAMLQGKKRK